MSMPETPVPSVWGKPMASPASPWGALAAAAPAPCSLQEVMSEQLASELQNKTAINTETTEPARGEPLGAAVGYDVDLSAFIVDDMDPEEQMQMLMAQVVEEQQMEKVDQPQAVVTPESKAEQEASDILMAQMLQHEFDLEHDNVLKREEAKFNGTSKVTLNFTHYRNVHPAMAEDEDSENEDDYLWEEQPVKDTTPQFKRGTGISGKGKNIVTKHDSTICGRKNATRIMDRFPPEFETGDGQGIDMKLPNHVYNKLKRHSVAVDKRSARLHEKKEHATAEMAVDQKTRLIMYKLVNSEVLENVNGVISAGKESVVFHADGGGLTTELVPSECAIKVFKTTLNEFKNRIDYVRGDKRFMKDEFKKQNPRRIIKMWAQKEEQNLRRLESAGVPCPHVVTLKKHVLVMSFIGKNQLAAPKLKDARLSTVDTQIAYEQCIAMMKKMYNEAGLVHADFSEYNLLWHDDMVYVIDVSQAVTTQHPHAGEFLLRDCENICSFFTRKGVPNVPTKFQLFNDITGLELHGDEGLFLKKLQDYEKNEEKLRMEKGKDYPFDFFFDMAQKEREIEIAQRLDQMSDSDTDTDSDQDDTPISKSPGSKGKGPKSGGEHPEKKGARGGSGKKGQAASRSVTGKTAKLKQGSDLDGTN